MTNIGTVLTSLSEMSDKLFQQRKRDFNRVISSITIFWVIASVLITGALNVHYGWGNKIISALASTTCIVVAANQVFTRAVTILGGVILLYAWGRNRYLNFPIGWFFIIRRFIIMSLCLPFLIYLNGRPVTAKVLFFSEVGALAFVLLCAYVTKIFRPKN